MSFDQPDNTDAHGSPAFVEGQIVSGRYRIVRFLGRGGMGEVYEAADLELRERVAVKTLRPDVAGDARSINRFKQEIQLSRRVAHPNVCKVFDLVRHSANDSSPSVIYFLTMELLIGETLEARIRREGPMSTNQALPIIEQISAALDAAHQAGIIHRDFKPSNIMLVGGPLGTRAVVTDFGLARSSASPDKSGATQTLTGHVMGTPGYIAPEVLAGSVVTIRADIYALGVAVYRLIAGTLPTSPAIMVKGVDPNWNRAIQRALDPSPENRFSSAGEFMNAIRGAVPTWRIPVKPMILVGGMLAAVLLVGVMWQGWERWRAQPSLEAMQLYRTGTNYLHAGRELCCKQGVDGGRSIGSAPSVGARPPG